MDINSYYEARITALDTSHIFPDAFGQSQFLMPSVGDRIRLPGTKLLRGAKRADTLGNVCGVKATRMVVPSKHIEITA